MGLKVIVTTDVHGSILAYDFINSEKSDRGLSRLSTYLKGLRKSNDVIYIDNGDINQGIPLVSYSNYNITHNIVAKALNLLECKYINIGNHDFNYGTDFLMKYIKENRAECLTSNVEYKDEKIGKSRVIEINGKRIGFIGVVTDYIEHWERPENIENIIISDVFDTLKKEVENIKNTVDYVIVLYHGGFERDIDSGGVTEPFTGENVGYKICEEIEGIDVLITGHQHRMLSGKINRTLIIQCPDGCKNCMEIDISDNDIEVRNIDLRYIDIDEEFEQNFSEELKRTEEWLDIKIGECNIEDMYITDIKRAQIDKHPIVSFINKVQLEITKAEISACCLFDVMPGFGKKLRYRDIILNYPFPNTLVVKKIKGSELIRYLDKLAAYWTVNEGNIDISEKFLKPKREVYNYDMLDGISYTINLSKSGNYVSDCKIDGNNIKAEQYYTIAVNNYRAAGGGNFDMFPNAQTVFEDTRDISEIIIEYISEHKKIYIEDIKNIKINIVE